MFSRGRFSMFSLRFSSGCGFFCWRLVEIFISFCLICSCFAFISSMPSLDISITFRFYPRICFCGVVLFVFLSACVALVLCFLLFSALVAILGVRRFSFDVLYFPS